MHGDFALLVVYLRWSVLLICIFRSNVWRQPCGNAEIIRPDLLSARQHLSLARWELRPSRLYLFVSTKRHWGAWSCLNWWSFQFIGHGTCLGSRHPGFFLFIFNSLKLLTNVQLTQGWMTCCLPLLQLKAWTPLYSATAGETHPEEKTPLF